MATNLTSETFTLNKINNFLEIITTNETYVLNLYSNPYYTVYNNDITIYTDKRKYMLDYTKSTESFNNIDEFLVDLRFKLSPIKNSNYVTEVAYGNVPTETSIIQFGECRIGVTRKDIWPVDQEYIALGVTGEKLIIISDSEMDIFGGVTGAHTITLQGLDENNNMIQETVLMNGITGNITTNYFSHLNRAIITSSGNCNSNCGNIEIKTNNDIYAGYINKNDGITQQCIYKAPYNYSLMVEGGFFSVHNTNNIDPKVTFELWYVYPNGTTMRTMSVFLDSQVNPAELFKNAVGQFLPANTIVKLRAYSDQPNTLVSCALYIIVKK